MIQSASNQNHNRSDISMVMTEDDEHAP